MSVNDFLFPKSAKNLPSRDEVSNESLDADAILARAEKIQKRLSRDERYCQNSTQVQGRIIVTEEGYRILL